MSCSQANRDKMTRWGLDLLRVYYTIHHIDGKFNYLADLGSRWGNRFAQAKTSEGSGVKRGLRGGPQPLLRILVTEDEQLRAVPKRVLKLEVRQTAAAHPSTAVINRLKELRL